ncbi:MAG: fluoride efflux transporter CrcB [Aureispira sp.]|nr:fluoride efflux transporter CrcB [Aureispira sp.]
MLNFALVFLGGGLGSLCRYAVGLWLPSSSPQAFPWATLLANILACIVLGILVGWMAKHPISNPYKLLIGTGFCGGFSTFSTFSKETLALFQEQASNTAILYLSASLLLGIAAIYIGVLLSRLFT